MNAILNELRYSETSNISHLQDFLPSINSGVCRVTIFDVWEIPLKILGLLQIPFPGHSTDLNSRKVVSYHTSRWKIVFSYICLGRTLLFEFILSAQFFVHHIQVLSKFSFLFAITRYHSKPVMSCRPDPSPFSIPSLFPALHYSYLLELSEVSLYI